MDRKSNSTSLQDCLYDLSFLWGNTSFAGWLTIPDYFELFPDRLPQSAIASSKCDVARCNFKEITTRWERLLASPLVQNIPGAPAPDILLRMLNSEWEYAFNISFLDGPTAGIAELTNGLQKAARVCEPMIKQMMAAMEAAASVPRESFTPHDIANVKEKIESLPKQPDGKDAKTDAVVKAVGGARQLTLNILGYLNDRGEYNGYLKKRRKR